MKARFISLLLLIILLNGCTAIGHMEFKNIPINGKLDQLANELIKLGFTNPQLVKENQIKLKGVFSGKNCEIYVYATIKNNTPYKVRINLQAEVQDSLKSSFEKLQKQYAAEYGIGTTRYEQYRNRERLMFNEPRLKRRLMKGDYSKYITASGDITIEVQDGYISITYLDNVNYEIRKREMEDEYEKEINMDS